MATLSSMKSGESAKYALNGHQFGVRYDSRQSYGDNNRPVRGAVTGEYTVTHPGGGVSTHEHGPHALTPQAAKRGANPNAKGYAAGQAWSAMTGSATREDVKAGVFRDRR